MTKNTVPDPESVDMPWYERPYMPRVNASLAITRNHPIDTFDRARDEPASSRVIGIHVGDLTVHIGVSGGDAEIVEVASRLIEALVLLQDNAIRRQAEQLPAEAVPA